MSALHEAREVWDAAGAGERDEDVECRAVDADHDDRAALRAESDERAVRDQQTNRDHDRNAAGDPDGASSPAFSSRRHSNGPAARARLEREAASIRYGVRS